MTRDEHSKPGPAHDASASPLERLLATLGQHYPGDDLGVVSLACAELEQDDRGHESLHMALDTAHVVATLRLDPAAVASALLARHVLRDRSRVEGVRERFGAEVASLVEGVCRLVDIRWDRIEEEAAETLRKMFLAMARDVRVVIVVLAMRVQAMRALKDGSPLPERDRERLARETLSVFAPLANRLGIWQLKWELEDWSLRVLDPAVYEELARSIDRQREELDSHLEELIETLRAKLAADGIEAKISGRAKHIYSIYKKMQRKDVGLEAIFDVTAVRVIVDKLSECYAALGVVHSSWVPVPNEFDDYIAKPKENGYQSLHTAVIGPGGHPFEVQIRTSDMHRYAEYGVAAHWAYKERKSAHEKQNEKFMVLRQLMSWERDVADPHDFVESLKTDIFEDQAYVFTPQGDIIDLPLGSTPLDFAYRIHTSVGSRCRGARVNGQIQPLDYQLKTGDRVEILTQKQEQPSRDWMNPTFGFLKTSSARQKVRTWFRQQERETAVREGKELVERELARLGLVHTTVEDVAASLDHRSPDELFAAVGYGDRHPQGVGLAALQLEREKAPPSEPPLPPAVPSAARQKRAASGLSLDGVDDILGKRARCCNPVPGDRVVGFVTRGRGIMIHRKDCGHIASTPEPERLVTIDWGPGAGEKHAVEVEIRAHDRPGLLGEISSLVAALGANVASARAARQKDGVAALQMSLDCSSADQVVRILQRIDQLPEVVEVRRLASL